MLNRLVELVLVVCCVARVLLKLVLYVALVFYYL